MSKDFSTNANGALKLIEIVSFLNKYKIKNTTINRDFTVDVEGDVNLEGELLNEIPFQFGKVTGNFNCCNNNLTSLKGSPKYVGRDFSCGYNKLTSLKGSPEYVGGRFWGRSNKLTSLEGAPDYIGGSCNFDVNVELKSLKGLKNIRGKNIW